MLGTTHVLARPSRSAPPRPDLERRIVVVPHESELGRWFDAACLPSADLAGLVSVLWYGEGELAYRRDRILPRGCAHLLVNLGAPQYLLDLETGARREFRDVWFSGAHETYLDTAAPDGVALLGVSFQPHGAYTVIASDQDELAEEVVELASLLGDGARALRQRLLETPALADRFALVESWLLDHAARGRAPHPATRWAVERIEQSAGQVRIEELSRATGYSRKHLAALFRREVGLGPKAIARVHRFHAALVALRQRSSVHWGELAAECGYYDQSHLIRDFRAFSGYTPEEVLATAAPDVLSLVVD